VVELRIALYQVGLPCAVVDANDEVCFAFFEMLGISSSWIIGGCTGKRWGKWYKLGFHLLRVLVRPLILRLEGSCDGIYLDSNKMRLRDNPGSVTLATSPSIVPSS
jgi:hypothetical protein